MKHLFLCFSCALILTGCGRTYVLIGYVVFQDVDTSSITEVETLEPPAYGIPLQGAEVTLFHELEGDLPKLDSSWSASVHTDSTGYFHLVDYSAPGKRVLVGLQVQFDGYETAFSTYYDDMDRREQYFIIVLRKQD